MNFPNFFIIFAPPHHIKLAATLLLSFINIFFSFGVVIIKFYQELFLWRVSHEISCRHGGDEKLIWFLSELFSRWKISKHWEWKKIKQESWEGKEWKNWKAINRKYQSRNHIKCGFEGFENNKQFLWKWWKV